MIDLHTHSTVSDGSEPPAQVVRLAAAAGLRAVALTDHDRFDGLAEAGAEAARLGVELVPGCEVSCRGPGDPASAAGSAHVLVYFPDEDGPLSATLATLRRNREDRNRRLVARLVELGLPVTWEEVVAEAGGEDGLGRPHVAAVLVRHGVVGSIQEAFDRYLGPGGAAYLPKDNLGLPEVARLAAASGGLCVLAHPLSLGLPEASLARFLEDLAGLGFAGAEAFYGRYRPEERQLLERLARRAGLVPTGGSDFHGTYKPDLAVGTGQGDLAVPDWCLEELLARRPARPRG
jgi:predicted metal-dependent phosphoesterase TrpH